MTSSELQYLESNKEKIIEYYYSGKTIREIAKIYSKRRSKISQVLDLWKLKKPFNERLKGKPSPTKIPWNENIFKQNTPETAYWAGFLYADGCLLKNPKGDSYTLKLSVADQDYEHLKKYRDFLGKDLNIHKYDYSNKSKDFYNRQPFSTVSCSGLNLGDDLIRWGIIPNKTYNFVKPNISKELLPHFLRGCIDGDGCIYYKRSEERVCGIRLSFVSSVNFCEYFINSFRQIGFEGNLKFKNSKTLNPETHCYVVLNGSLQVKRYMG